MVALDIEVKITIDGEVWNGSFGCLANTKYYIHLLGDNETLRFSTDPLLPFYYDTMKGKSVKIEYRLVGAPEANQILTGQAHHTILKGTT